MGIYLEWKGIRGEKQTDMALKKEKEKSKQVICHLRHSVGEKVQDTKWRYSLVAEYIALSKLSPLWLVRP